MYMFTLQSDEQPALPVRFRSTKIVLFVQIRARCRAYQGVTERQRRATKVVGTHGWLANERKTYRWIGAILKQDIARGLPNAALT